MKRTVYLLFALLTISSSAFAQGFYFRGGLGYDFSMSGETSDGNGTPLSGSVKNGSYTQTYSINRVSFGTGLQANVAVGYMFTRNVGIDLGLEAILAPKSYSFSIDSVNYGGVESSLTYTQKANNPVFLVPALVMQTDNEKWNIYSRVGIVLPLSTAMTQDQIIQNLPGTGALTTDDFTFKMTNSFSVGFSGTVGVKCAITDRLKVFGEFNFFSLSVLTKTSDISAFSENGVSYSTKYVTGGVHKVYSKTPVVDSNANQQVAYPNSFSHLGVNVGVSFSIGRQRSPAKKVENDGYFKKKSHGDF